MAARILLVSLFLSLLVACDKKEDDITPGRDYKGSLTLEYSRCFPTINQPVVIGLEVNQAGTVTFVAPQSTQYTAEADKMIEEDRIRIKEEGTITITSLTGKWVDVDGKAYLQVSLSCYIDGTHTVWRHDGVQWQQIEQTQFNLENPAQQPMLFRIENAERDGSVCGATTSDKWSPICFRWKLLARPV